MIRTWLHIQFPDQSSLGLRVAYTLLLLLRSLIRLINTTYSPLNEFVVFVRRNGAEKLVFGAHPPPTGREFDVIVHVQSAGAALLYHQTTSAFNRLHDRSRSTIYFCSRIKSQAFYSIKVSYCDFGWGQQIKSSRFACKQNRRVTKAKRLSRRQTKRLKRHCRPEEAASSWKLEWKTVVSGKSISIRCLLFEVPLTSILVLLKTSRHFTQ